MSSALDASSSNLDDDEPYENESGYDTRKLPIGEEDQSSPIQSPESKANTYLSEAEADQELEIHNTTQEAGQLPDDADEALQENARRQWLQYYMQTGQWSKASELVVSADERDDLDYLKVF